MGTNQYQRPAGLLMCPRRCQHRHTPECIILTEINYLGQVGALDHLAEIGRKLGLDAPADDRTYVDHPAPTGRKSAFPVYEQALSTAVASLEGGQFASNSVARTLGRAWEEGSRVRAALLRKGHPVPGRDRWLKVGGAS